MGFPSRRLIQVKCDFCHQGFYKQAYKLTRINRSKFKFICCKSCNGLSSAYTKTDTSKSTHDFFLEYVKQRNIHTDNILSNTSSSEHNRSQYKCPYCLTEFSIRNDAILVKKTFACNHCESIHFRYIKSDKLKSEHDFYLDIQSKIRFDLIDINATKSKYGYNPHNLPIYSDKLVVSKCEFCLTECDVHFKNFLIREHINCKSCIGLSSTYSEIFNNPNDYFKSIHSHSLNKNIIKKTIEKFGYDPQTKSSNSKYAIATNCYFCDKDITVQLRSFIAGGNVVSCQDCRRKKLAHSLMQKYGVSTINSIPSVIEKMADPYTNRLVEHILKTRYKIDYIREFPIKSLQFDFCIPSLKLLIECQGDYFHDFKKNGYSGTPRDMGKATYVSRYTDFKLIHIWEHEIHLGRLVKILDHHIYAASDPIISVSLNQLEFKPISLFEASSFLTSFHYLGFFTSASRAYGAFYNGQLICVSLFGGITRNQSINKINRIKEDKYTSYSVRELKRFCIRPNIICDNLASFSLKRFVDLLKNDIPHVKAVISFSDPTVCDIGTIYKASNWDQLPSTSKSYHYLDTKFSRVIHKKTVWDMASKIKMPEREFANKSGLMRVKELPKSVWVKILT
jgi:hypothetical protein